MEYHYIATTQSPTTTLVRPSSRHSTTGWPTDLYPSCYITIGVVIVPSQCCHNTISAALKCPCDTVHHSTPPKTLYTWWLTTPNTSITNITATLASLGSLYNPQPNKVSKGLCYSRSSLAHLRPEMPLCKELTTERRRNKDQGSINMMVRRSRRTNSQSEANGSAQSEANGSAQSERRNRCARTEKETVKNRGVEDARVAVMCWWSAGVANRYNVIGRGAQCSRAVRSVIEWCTVSHGWFSVFAGPSEGRWRLVRAVHRAVGPSSRRDLARSVRRQCTVLTSFDFRGSNHSDSSSARSVHRCVLWFVDPLLHRPSFSPSVRHSLSRSVVDPSVCQIAARFVGFWSFLSLGFCHRLIEFFVVSSNMPQSPAGAVPLVHLSFGPSCLDWSDAPIVVFRRSFDHSVTRSIGLRRPFAVLSIVSLLDPLLSVVLFAVLSAIPLLPLSYPPSFPSFLSIHSLVRQLSAALSAFLSLDLLLSVVLSPFYRPFYCSIHWFLSSFRRLSCPFFVFKCLVFQLFLVAHSFVHYFLRMPLLYFVLSPFLFFSTGTFLHFSTFFWLPLSQRCACRALIMADAQFPVLGASFTVLAYKEGLVSLRKPGASSSRPSVVSFDANDYSHTFCFSGLELEGSGFFIRGPGMGHVLSLEINFIVPVEVQPGLGPPSYDYVRRAQKFPVRGDVSRNVPPAGSSPFVPLFRPLAAGTFSILIWSVSAS
ncbi:uncharacterized protein G2W53_039640 [Senna tora]|uniref:Uncharacterized protein n=1 Tax=Senna tora TaxID=362788 RepID=A0A834T1K9_9FABA|nr:uncharacterized protein G2W53_039640 [Senna tora]